MFKVGDIVVDKIRSKKNPLYKIVAIESTGRSYLIDRLGGAYGEKIGVFVETFHKEFELLQEPNQILKEMLNES